MTNPIPKIRKKINDAWQRLVVRSLSLRRSPVTQPDSADSRDAVSLTENRPAMDAWKLQYELVSDQETVTDVFQKLKDHVYKELDRSSVLKGDSLGKPVKYFREAGRIGLAKPYFFLKPAGDKGFLFEKSVSGWTLSRAEKICAQNLFLRDSEPFDYVTLYANHQLRRMPKVASQLLGEDILPFAAYERVVLDVLGIDDGKSP
jgi:hypothetical protein